MHLPWFFGTAGGLWLILFLLTSKVICSHLQALKTPRHPFRYEKAFVFPRSQRRSGKVPGTVVTAELACRVYITNPKSAHNNLCLLTCETQTAKLRHFHQGGAFSCSHLEGSEAPCKYNKPKPARLGLQYKMQDSTYLTLVLPPETQITQPSHPSAYQGDFLAHASQNTQLTIFVGFKDVFHEKKWICRRCSKFRDRLFLT